MNLPTPDGTVNCRSLYMLALCYLLSSENQIVSELPKMIKHADDLQLKLAFQSSLQETQVHVTLLEEIINEVNDAESFREKDTTIAAFLRSCENIINEVVEGPVRDAALLAGALEIKRHEIASYDAAIDWAKVLCLHRHVEQLQKTLDETHGAENLSAISLRGSGKTAAA